MRPHDRTRAILASDLPGVQRMVLIAVASHLRGDDDAEVWPSLARLVELTGFKRTAVLSAVKALESRGVLQAARRRGQATRYRVVWSGLTSPGDGRVPVRETDGCINSDPSARRTTPVRETDDTRPRDGPEVEKEDLEEEKTPQPRRTSAPRKRKSSKPSTPAERAVGKAWKIAYEDTHGSGSWSWPASDAHREWGSFTRACRSVAPSFDGQPEILTAALAAYVATVSKRHADGYGDPPSLQGFARDVGKWRAHGASKAPRKLSADDAWSLTMRQARGFYLHPRRRDTDLPPSVIAAIDAVGWDDLVANRSNLDTFRDRFVAAYRRPA